MEPRQCVRPFTAKLSFSKVVYSRLHILHYNFGAHVHGDNSAVWFKVHEAGKSADGKWAATDVLAANNWAYTFTIPASLAPGQYIIRHEIIALHSAWSYPYVTTTESIFHAFIMLSLKYLKVVHNFTHPASRSR
jgi:hypothetical protein